jgi:hypothetical protein
LSSGRCPTGLQLNLLRTNIGEAAAAQLAEALSTGRCPTGLQLDLRDNKIGDAGAAKLAEALSSGRSPAGLQLKLAYNKIGDAGAAKLAAALSTGRCPAGLQLNLADNNIGEVALQQINKLLDAHEKRYAALSCVAFRQGLRSADSPVKKLPDPVANAIFSFVLPATSPAASLFFKQQIKQAALPARLASKVPLESRSDSQEKEASIKPQRTTLG